MNAAVLPGPPIVLEDGLDVKKLFTTGSLLHINDYYNCTEHVESDSHYNDRNIQFIGKPVTSFEEFQKQLEPIDKHGWVKKNILEVGGGMPLDNSYTVSLIFSGFWENTNEPFDLTKTYKPLVVNLKENGLLPGIQMAIESMLVGELAVFLLSYKVMYGELGIPPRIKPKADCVFYIKLVKSVITPKEGEINFDEPNVFKRVQHEVKLLYSSGVMLYKTNNYSAAAQVFRKAVNMLHKCRLADEGEECIQEKLLKKLYLNLAICNNELKLPLKACTACNELNRLKGLWNNEKALYQNAKALRMIGDFDAAVKKLNAAMKINPKDNLKTELELVQKLKASCSQKKLVANQISTKSKNIIRNNFKSDIDDLIKIFKDHVDLYKFTLPGDLNDAEKEYIKEACTREQLYFTESNQNYLLDKEVDDEIGTF